VYWVVKRVNLDGLAKKKRISYCTCRELKHRQPACIPSFIKTYVLLSVSLSVFLTTYLRVESITGISLPVIQSTYIETS
jgi:hypothetical protein